MGHYCLSSRIFENTDEREILATDRFGINVTKTMRKILMSLPMLAALAAAAADDAVEVVVEGIDEELRRNVLLLLSIERQKAEPALTEGRIRTLHERASGEIRRALEPFGYYRPQIRAQLTHEQGRWTARYAIDPGPPLLVEELDLVIEGEGLEDAEFRRLVAEFPLRRGEALQHGRYEEGKRALLRLADERGYFDAVLRRHEIRVDLERYRAAAVLHLDTGPRYRFGEVRIEQDFFDPAFLARFVPFARGEPYTNAALLRLQAALSDADYFQQVEVRPRRDLAVDLEVPIDVILVLRSRDRYLFGLGYGTDTGARGKLGWERRLINPAGHRFAAELDVSEIRTALSARYRIPVRDPRTDQLVLSAALTDDHPLTSTSRTATLGVSHERSRGDWRQALSLSYLREKFIAGDDTGRAALLMPGASWVRVRSDERVRPRRGSRLSLDVRGANESLASDVSFGQLRLSGKYIHPAGDGGRLIARAEAGYTRVSVFEELPASLRFYAGGSQSVRGYAFQALGPLNEAGQVIGGRYLLVGSLEYDHRLTESWGVAVFYDAGKAFNDASAPFSEGAGVGVRWHLPIGVLRLDFARALSLEGRPWRVHFWIGPDL
jgi:translocation and assembly module TamA